MEALHVRSLSRGDVAIRVLDPVPDDGRVHHGHQGRIACGTLAPYARLADLNYRVPHANVLLPEVPFELLMGPLPAEHVVPFRPSVNELAVSVVERPVLVVEPPFPFWHAVISGVIPEDVILLDSYAEGEQPHRGPDLCQSSAQPELLPRVQDIDDVVRDEIAVWNVLRRFENRERISGSAVSVVPV